MTSKIRRGSTSEQSASSNKIENLIRKRTRSFDYLQKVMDGLVPFYCSVRLTPEAIATFCAKEWTGLDKRLLRWFALGNSLAKLLGQPNVSGFATAFDKLLAEWEYYFSNTVQQSMKLVKSGFATAVEYAKKVSADHTLAVETGSSTAPSPHTGQSSNIGFTRTYEYLSVPHVPFPLDFLEVVFALLEMLRLGYKRLLGESLDLPETEGAILTLDRRLKTQLLSPLSKDLTAIAKAVVTRQSVRLHALFADISPVVKLAPTQSAVQPAFASIFANRTGVTSDTRPSPVSYSPVGQAVDEEWSFVEPQTRNENSEE